MKPIALAFTLTALLSPALARAEAEKIEVKVGTVAPDGTPWSELLKKMKRDMRKAFEEDGLKLKLKTYLGGRLGGEKEMVRETREGRIQMYGGSVSSIATIVPELYILESPFLFASDEEADFVLERIRPEVEALLAERGFVFYQWAENGWHGIALKGSCVDSLDVLADKKVRSQEASVHLDTFKALGANPVEMAVPEVLAALKQGVVDGFSNTPLFAFATSWYQGVDSFTRTNHIYQPGVMVYSKKWFDRQPKEVQENLLMNPREYEAFGRRGVRAIRQGLVDNFKREKMEVCEVSPELRQKMKEATASVFAKYRDDVSPAGKPVVQALVAAKKAWADR
jgi:TRAP-type C4-dicarboxylate transport system substrate-binding protein